MFTELIFLIENLNMSLPISIDRVFKNFKNKSNKSGETPNNNKPPQKRFNYRNIIQLSLLILLLLASYNSMVKNSSQEITFTNLHRESVLDDLKGVYWKYVSDNNIKKTSDFSPADFEKLKEFFWNIIMKKRTKFSQVSLGYDTIIEVRKTYPHDEFIKDFNYFIQKHKDEPFDEFSENVFKYVEEMQDKISSKIFN